MPERSVISQFKFIRKAIAPTYPFTTDFAFINVLRNDISKKLLNSFQRTDVLFPGMAGNSVELRELLAKRTAEITRKCARGANRSGSAKRPHFRFVRQSVSCALRARDGNPFVFLDGCGRVKGNNAASNHSSAWPLSENLTRALLSASPFNPPPVLLRPRVFPSLLLGSHPVCLL